MFCFILFCCVLFLFCVLASQTLVAKSFEGYSILKKFCLMFIYFWGREKETEHKQGRGSERGRHRIQSRLQAPSHQYRARSRVRTHEPWDHELSQSLTLNRLSHQGAPTFFFFKFIDLFWETETMWVGRGREWEGDRESQVGSVSLAQSLVWGLNPQKLWDHDLSRNQESAT